ncbi:hypothetical protein LP417_20250 [Polaromonas sp. P1-6]|nr:hypothetical protein LP417_20250 [Polaromonas sp. P1-6]
MSSFSFDSKNAYKPCRTASRPSAANTLKLVAAAGIFAFDSAGSNSITNQVRNLVAVLLM